jgi:hypothetical protein
VDKSLINAELIAIADILGVTVDELLGRPKPADEAIVDALSDATTAQVRSLQQSVTTWRLLEQERKNELTKCQRALAKRNATIKRLRARNEETPAPYTLTDAVRDEGFELVVVPNPHEQAGVLGESDPTNSVRIATNGFLFATDDSWDSAYSASHEIAEYRYGFRHSAEMFAMQANILARWLKRVASNSSKTIVDLHAQLNNTDASDSAALVRLRSHIDGWCEELSMTDNAAVESGNYEDMVSMLAERNRRECAPPAQPDLFVADAASAMNHLRVRVGRGMPERLGDIAVLCADVSAQANIHYAPLRSELEKLRGYREGAIEAAEGYQQEIASLRKQRDAIGKELDEARTDNAVLQDLRTADVSRLGKNRDEIRALKTTLKLRDESIEQLNSLRGQLSAQLAASEQRGWRELSTGDLSLTWDKFASGIGEQEWDFWGDIPAWGRQRLIDFANACIRAASSLPENAVTRTIQRIMPGSIGIELSSGDGGEIMKLESEGSLSLVFIPDAKPKLDLTELAKQAREAVDAMTEDELRDMLEKQSKSFARGQVAMSEEDRRRRGE